MYVEFDEVDIHKMWRIQMEGSVVDIGVGKVLVRGFGWGIDVLSERRSCYNF